MLDSRDHRDLEGSDSSCGAGQVVEFTGPPRGAPGPEGREPPAQVGSWPGNREGEAHFLPRRVR